MTGRNFCRNPRSVRFRLPYQTRQRFRCATTEPRWGPPPGVPDSWERITIYVPHHRPRRLHKAKHLFQTRRAAPIGIVFRIAAAIPAFSTPIQCPSWLCRIQRTHSAASPIADVNHSMCHAHRAETGRFWAGEIDIFSTTSGATTKTRRDGSTCLCAQPLGVGARRKLRPTHSVGFPAVHHMRTECRGGGGPPPLLSSKTLLEA